MNGTCGWPTATGPCRRPYRPEGCGFHPPPLDPAGLVRQTCTCERPFIAREEDGEPTCFFCGEPRQRRRVMR